MRTIWKFELKAPACSIEMPAGAAILTVQTQNNRPVLWAEVDPSVKSIKRKFLTVPTGAEFDIEPAHYVGTFQLHGGVLIFHVYTDRVEYPLHDTQEKRVAE